MLPRMGACDVTRIGHDLLKLISYCLRLVEPPEAVHLLDQLSENQLCSIPR
jgi:hypothetical protein